MCRPFAEVQSGLIFINRNASDGAEVTHFKISGITNGTLYLADGVTRIDNGDYITVEQGQAGLRFTPAANSTADGSFNVESSEDGVSVASQSGIATSIITVLTPASPPSEPEQSPPKSDPEQVVSEEIVEQEESEDVEDVADETDVQADADNMVLGGNASNFQGRQALQNLLLIQASPFSNGQIWTAMMIKRLTAARVCPLKHSKCCSKPKILGS